MRWEMGMEEVEAVLERIWDLHDSLSDAIHAVSRAHFLHSVRPLASSTSPSLAGAGAVTGSDAAVAGEGKGGGGGGGGGGGFVFVKGFKAGGQEKPDDGVSGAAAAAAMEEAKSLNGIRTALENLEDQLEFFHTVQLQQLAERDAAIARLEQSRLILAMRLADYQGKKYKVIEEALALIGDVHDKGHFVTPETLYETSRNQTSMNLDCARKKSILMQMLMSSFSLAKTSFKLEKIGGVLGNAAMFAVSMLALLQIHQVALKNDNQQVQDPMFYKKRNEKNVPRFDIYIQSNQKKNLNVLSARG